MPQYSGIAGAVAVRDDIKRSLSSSEVAELRRQRPEMRATLACEGMHLTAEEEDLFDAMEAERLTPDQRIARIIAFDEERHARRASNTLVILAGSDR